MQELIVTAEKQVNKNELPLLPPKNKQTNKQNKAKKKDEVNHAAHTWTKGEAFLNIP